MKRLFLIFLFLLIACPLWGATVYVSNEADNGFQIGNDSNSYAQSQSKSTPWLTLTKAVTSCANGDTIVLNDGTYVEAGEITPSKTSLTITPYSDYGATIQAGGVNSIFTANNNKIITIGKIIFDGQNNHTIGFLTYESGHNITINGTRFINYKASGVYASNSGAQSTLTLNNIDCSTSYIGAIDSLYLAGNLTVIINGGTILNSASSGNNVITGVRTSASSARTLNITINDLYITNTASGTNASSMYGLLVAGASTLSVYGGAITFTSGWKESVYQYGIKIGNDDKFITSLDISNVDINMNDPHTSWLISRGIFLGESTSGSYNNSINGIKIYDNDISNAGMGIFSGYLTAGQVYKNNITSTTAPLVSGGGNLNWLWNHNTINGLVGSDHTGLLSAGSVNDKWYNNTISVGNDANDGWAMLSEYGATGADFKNNIVYSSSGYGNKMYAEVGNNGSDATFSNNLYYNSDHATPFKYGATTYANFALWQAAGKDVGALNVDPKFISNGINFHLQSDSPARGAGVNVGLSRTNPPDIGAEPYLQYVPWKH